jgi:cytochrome d ubiquinol oxidase subunit II
VSLATPLASATVSAKWFTFPRALYVMVLPIATLALGAWLWTLTTRMKAGNMSRDFRPFGAAMAIFALSFLGLAYSLFPYVVIDRLTVWEAAAHPSALKVIFVGTVVVLPFIIFYTAVAYRIFRGKAKAGLYD